MTQRPWMVDDASAWWMAKMERLGTVPFLRPSGKEGFWPGERPWPSEWDSRGRSSGSSGVFVESKRRIVVGCVCVCVSTPVPKGVFPMFCFQQGGNARLTDIAQRRRCQFVVKQCGTPHCVPAPAWNFCTVYSLGLFPWSLHDTSP